MTMINSKSAAVKALAEKATMNSYAATPLTGFAYGNAVFGGHKAAILRISAQIA